MGDDLESFLTDSRKLTRIQPAGGRPCKRRARRRGTEIQTFVFCSVTINCCPFATKKNRRQPSQAHRNLKQSEVDMKGRKTGGRRKGTSNKVTAEAKAVCAAIVDDPTYRKKLIARAKAGELAPAIEAMLWHYAYGKPKEQVEHAGGITLSWG